MKREFAATLFSIFLAGTALAGPIESSELPPPAQNQSADSDKLRGIIENVLRDKKETPPAQSFQHEDWNAYSSAELWLQGIPESEGISLDALATKARSNAGYGAVEENKSVPTAFTWNRGNWRANVGTNVTTASASPTVIPTEIYAGNISPSGGSGAINGRLEYDLNSWQFYGGTKRAIVANADGTLAVDNNFVGGTYYNLPPSLIGGKVGTGFEVNPVGDAKTKLEYRKMFGDIEGFLAAERTTPFQHSGPDVTGVNGLKAGINRKF
jgi:hypothetical protein